MRVAISEEIGANNYSPLHEESQRLGDAIGLGITATHVIGVRGSEVIAAATM